MDDYRIILKSENKVVDSIKRLLVNPIMEFTKVLEQARCVVLAGGTMDPKEEFVKLFSAVPTTHLIIHDFDHVIPAKHLQLSIISQAADRQPLRVDFNNRLKSHVLQAICDCIFRLCEIVPNGIVCFFGSFSYLHEFANFASKNNTLRNLGQLKTVIFDDRSNAFEQYQQAALTPQGAILFTVIRGSLSEGINFKHEVGRCVVIVGQPYPNLHDAELKAKMDFWDREGGEVTGSVYYSNSCFKAVNQCLGRVIRDKQDYAVAVLLDVRYRNNLGKLSAWMRRNLVMSQNRDEVYRAIERFFEELKSSGK